MSQKLHITDQRMLQVMDYCIANKVKGIDTNKAWCEAVGISQTNIFNIRNGMQQFRKEHLQQACDEFNISPDFLFGYSGEMLRNKKKTSPLDRIKEAVRELEEEGRNTKAEKKKGKKK